MIRIDGRIILAIDACRRKEDIYPFLQDAVALEHATIPPYLTALYSLVPGTNDAIASLIQSIVIEEMLHMTIAANLLVAIGGSPEINNSRFIPHYPGPLPMGIGRGLIVPIEKLSRRLVNTVFMSIEKPEHPIPVGHLRTYATVGQFYDTIKRKIRDLGDDIFVVGKEKQILSWFEPDLLFPLTDVYSANKAIDIIVSQGEGTRASPFTSRGELAHYYRFGEIYHGRKLIRTAHGRFAYRGQRIPFDRRGVYPTIRNPSPSDYPPGSHVEMLSRTFTYTYSSLLNALQASFHGSPRTIDTAIGLMQELRLQAQTLISTPLHPGRRRTAGPVFRYVTSQ